MIGSSKNSTMPSDAAEWDARLRSPDCTDAERQAFQTWCDAAPENRQAFDELQALLGALRSVADVPEIRSLREAAVNATRPPSIRRGRAVGVALLAATVAGIAVGLGYFMIGSPAPVYETRAPTFSTSIGERSTTELEDGSVAILNTNTQLQVEFTEHMRLVILAHGQALFEVAKDPERPFVVAAGDQRITAIGTVFDVRYEGPDVEVVLVEGVVEVEADVPLGTDLNESAPKLKALRMSAGEHLKTTAVATRRVPVVETVDVDRVTLWRQGRIFFDDAPLSEAVAEMNRYSTVQIALESSELDEHRVNGMFRTGRQAAFVEAVEAYYPIYAEHGPDKRIVLRAKGGQ